MHSVCILTISEHCSKEERHFERFSPKDPRDQRWNYKTSKQNEQKVPSKHEYQPIST